MTLAAPGCCNSVFEPAPPGERDAPWWTRLAHSLRCSIVRDAKPEPVMTPPGAMPIAQPVAPDPSMADGMMRTVQPEGTPAPTTPEPVDATTPGIDDHGRHGRPGHAARPRSSHERERTR